MAATSTSPNVLSVAISGAPARLSAPARALVSAGPVTLIVRATNETAHPQLLTQRGQGYQLIGPGSLSLVPGATAELTLTRPEGDDVHLPTALTLAIADDARDVELALDPPATARRSLTELLAGCAIAFAVSLLLAWMSASSSSELRERMLADAVHVTGRVLEVHGDDGLPLVALPLFVGLGSIVMILDRLGTAPKPAVPSLRA